MSQVGRLGAGVWSSTDRRLLRTKAPPAHIPHWGPLRLRPFSLHLPSRARPVTRHPVAVKGNVGAGGRDSGVGGNPPLQLPQRLGWGEQWPTSSFPLGPSLWLSQKELSVLLEHSSPSLGLVGGGGKNRLGVGWSLLPLSLSCLGSPLAPNLHRLLATEAEILARAGGGGRAGCPKL